MVEASSHLFHLWLMCPSWCRYHLQAGELLPTPPLPSSPASGAPMTLARRARGPPLRETYPMSPAAPLTTPHSHCRTQRGPASHRQKCSVPSCPPVSHCSWALQRCAPSLHLPLDPYRPSPAARLRATHPRTCTSGPARKASTDTTAPPSPAAATHRGCPPSLASVVAMETAMDGWKEAGPSRWLMTDTIGLQMAGFPHICRFHCKSWVGEGRTLPACTQPGFLGSFQLQ